MVEEYNSIMVNDVWEVVPRPQDRSMVGSRWIYKVKYAADDSVEIYKARRMATPMITNWKKIDALEDKDVDPTLYKQLIGSLMYLLNIRPNICYAVNTLSEFMVEPKRVHWAATKHVLRYIQGTVEHGLLHTRGNDIRLSGFIDTDWAGSSVDRKITTGYCFNIGLGMTSWCSRTQKSVALSSAEA
eukprot:PITA_25077